jgi:hypothetical protein
MCVTCFRCVIGFYSTVLCLVAWQALVGQLPTSENITTAGLLVARNLTEEEALDLVARLKKADVRMMQCLDVFLSSFFLLLLF